LLEEPFVFPVSLEDELAFGQTNAWNVDGDGGVHVVVSGGDDLDSRVAAAVLVATDVEGKLGQCRSVEG